MDKKTRVILADANEEFRELLRGSIEKTDEFEVVGVAGDGMSALKLVTEKKPELLIADILLPELDGFGLIDRLASLDERPSTLIVSALYRDSIVAQAMERDVAFFMPKPCETESLLERMRQALGMEALAEESEAQALER